MGEKRISISSLKVNTESTPEFEVRIVNNDGRDLAIRVTMNAEDFSVFADGLRTFPKAANDRVSLVWGSGATTVGTKTIDVGKVQLSAAVAELNGLCVVKLEILEPRKFEPGMKLSLEVGAYPSELNTMASSLAAWLLDSNKPFDFKFS